MIDTAVLCGSNFGFQASPMQFMEVILILIFQTSTPSFNKTMQALCDQISAVTLMTKISVLKRI